MSSVYLGQHVHMLKRVAIKVLDPKAEQLPELVARFQREAIAGAHVQHPNIASATDFGQLKDGSYFLVLEYVPGMTLNQLIGKGPLDVQRAVGHRQADRGGARRRARSRRHPPRRQARRTSCWSTARTIW